MTKAQDTLYWREWGNLTKRCKAEGWVLPVRHELHARALGENKSHKEFSNREFDKVLAVFRSFSQAENLHAQVRQERQPRTRLEHRIKIEQVKLLSVLLADGHNGGAVLADGHSTAQAVEPDMEGAFAYVEAIMFRRFGTADITLISDNPHEHGKSDLEMLRDTLDRCISQLRQKKVQASCKPSMESGWSEHDLKTAAGVPCHCALCRGPQRRAAAHAPREVAA